MILNYCQLFLCNPRYDKMGGDGDKSGKVKNSQIKIKVFHQQNDLLLFLSSHSHMGCEL